MYTLKGFLRVKSLINNTQGQNSPIGELSTLGLTYTRDRGEYFNAAQPDLALISMLSNDVVLGKIPVASAMKDHVLLVSAWLLAYAITKGNAINLPDLQVDIETQFATSAGNFILGTLVSNGAISVPSSIKWNNIVLDANNIQIWFSDSVFRTQYANSEIVVIPPIPNLNDFFLTAGQVKTKIEERPIQVSTDLIQLAKNGHPETVIRTNTYDYKNPAAPSIVVPTNWSVLIYGIAGDNIDAIKDAIITYILANSTRTREEWTILLPNLFKRTEFNLIPRWDKFAIPNLSIQQGIYSPVINLKETVVFVKARIPEIPAAHIDNFLESFSHPYRSLSVGSIGSPDNLNTNFSLVAIFPDLINVSTNNTDFNRMGTLTKQWLDMIDDMLVIAESINETTDAPLGTRKVKRGNTLYLAKTFANIQYLIACKSSYPV